MSKPTTRPKLATLRPRVALANTSTGATLGRDRKGTGLDLVDPYTHRRWKAIRARQLQKEPLCRFCEESGKTTPATVADHVEPHRNDPDLFWHGRLQSLCDSCHSGRKQREEHQALSGRAGTLPPGLPEKTPRRADPAPPRGIPGPGGRSRGQE